MAEEAVKERAPKRVLAIDYGEKRFGLALSDELGLTAQPLRTLPRTNRPGDLRRLREICRERGVAQIVIGLPLHLGGETSEMAARAARFAARLEKELGLPVEWQDERLTSWEAEQMASARKRSRQRRRGSLDDWAAAVVLREYLERKRGVPGDVAGKD
jgi:putative holliday junction resolvase